MRRIVVPGGGWVLLAALAIPIVYSSAKPLVRKFGKGMRDLGQKLMDESHEPVVVKKEDIPDVKEVTEEPSEPEEKNP